jgi:hypothetical protein
VLLSPIRAGNLNSNRFNAQAAKGAIEEAIKEQAIEEAIEEAIK